MNEYPPLSLDWMRRILDSSDDIYVRAQVNGRWTSIALSKLPPEAQAEHVKRWAAEDRRT